MAKLSQLVSTLSRTLGLELATVAQFARHTREAGFIRQGGRGLGAPDMQASDCAHLLIAIMGATYAKDSAKVIRRCSTLISLSKMRDVEAFPKALRALPEHHGFVDALIALIEAARKGDVRHSIHRDDNRKLFREAERLNELLLIPELMVGINHPFPTAWITLSMHRVSPTGFLDPIFTRADYQRVGPFDSSATGDLKQNRHITNETLVELGKLLNQ